MDTDIFHNPVTAHETVSIHRTITCDALFDRSSRLLALRNVARHLTISFQSATLVRKMFSAWQAFTGWTLTVVDTLFTVWLGAIGISAAVKKDKKIIVVMIGR